MWIHKPLCCIPGGKEQRTISREGKWLQVERAVTTSVSHVVIYLASFDFGSLHLTGKKHVGLVCTCRAWTFALPLEFALFLYKYELKWSLLKQCYAFHYQRWSNKVLEHVTFFCQVVSFPNVDMQHISICSLDTGIICPLHQLNCF